MYLLAFVLLYLGIVKHFEPLLLIPIAFGVLIANFPGGDMGVYQADEAGCIRDAAGNVIAENIWKMSLPEIAHELGLMNFLYYMLIKTGFLPPIIFMGSQTSDQCYATCASPSSEQLHSSVSSPYCS